MKLNNFKTVFAFSNIARRFVMTAALALGATGLYAERLPIHVTVPFAFTVSGHVMPMGEYSIKPLEGMPGAVALHHMTEGVNMLALARPGSDAMTTASLVFTVVDEGKALSSVVAPGWTLSFPTPAPLNKPLAKLEVRGVTAMVRAR